MISAPQVVNAFSNDFQVKQELFANKAESRVTPGTAVGVDVEFLSPGYLIGGILETSYPVRRI